MKKNMYLLSVLMIVASVGCSRIVKESYYGATGATGRAEELHRVTVDLADYDSFVVEPFTDGMEGRGNMSFLAMVQEKVAGEIVKKTYLGTGGGKVLQITGELIMYDTGSTTEKVAGPMEEAVCRVKLVDKSSGDVLGLATCIGRAKSSVRKGPEELAEGMGKAIADWIIKHDIRGARPEDKE